jgi:ABC-type amino acid transport system permease subunit
VGFEHRIPVFERAKIFLALDRAVIVIGTPIIIYLFIFYYLCIPFLASTGAWGVHENPVSF